MHSSSRVNPLLLLILLGGLPIVSCGGSEDRQFAPQTGTGGSGGSGASSGRGGRGGSGATDGTGGTDGSSGTGGTNGAGGSSSCQSAADCDDTNSCNGSETCSATATCESGTNAADKTPCTRAGATGNHYCDAGNCAPSRCGDGVVDAAAQEQCDDANEINGDGCEEDCKFTCSATAECDNANACDGAETCDSALHKCVAGPNVGDGASCGSNRVCRQGSCVPVGCGNRIKDGTEDCDDGNTTEADGCENDCTFSCKVDADCDNTNRCDGVEKCTVATHVCAPGTALNCDDAKPCTRNECNPETGCVNPLVDADLDGHAPQSLGACGDDCNDADRTIFTGAEELCDNKDNNCNGIRDDSAPKWFVDCDGDTYAPAGASPVQQCDKPPPSSTCDAGTVRDWTNRVPADLGSIDCWDKAANVNPSIVSWFVDAIPGRPVSVDFDYNCDNVETQFWTSTGITATSPCRSFGGIGGIGGIAGAFGATSETGSGGTSGTEEAAAGIGGIGGVAPLCSGVDGWTGTVAADCGRYANFSECTTSGSSCVRPPVYSKRQQCH